MSTFEFIQYLSLAAIVGWMMGMIMGKIFESNIWREKGNHENRTAKFSKGNFYYVITEKEYCEHFLKRHIR
jgi:hypothetical protein